MVLWVIFGSLMASNSGRDRAQRSWILEREKLQTERERERSTPREMKMVVVVCVIFPRFSCFYLLKISVNFQNFPPFFTGFLLAFLLVPPFFFLFLFVDLSRAIYRRRRWNCHTTLQSRAVSGVVSDNGELQLR